MTTIGGIDFKEHYGDEYPVPYIIKWADDKPDFKLMDEVRVRECNSRNLCSVCGQHLNMKKAIAWVGGEHTTEEIESGALWFADPPMHVECATFSVKHCPYLRGEGIREETPDGTQPDGGVYCIYVCRGRIINENGFSTRPQSVTETRGQRTH